MIACLDVDYRDPGAVAAGLWFRDWQDSTSSAEVVLAVEEVAPYRSGELYRRELPCLLAVLEKGPPQQVPGEHSWGDEKLTTALLDRLTHHTHILTTRGNSYRTSRRTPPS